MSVKLGEVPIGSFFTITPSEIVYLRVCGGFCSWRDKSQQWSIENYAAPCEIVPRCIVNNEPLQSLKQLAQTAIELQDACNLSGLIHRWSRDISHLRQHCDAAHTQVNVHPINVLWASKVVSLTGELDSAAYEECRRLANVQ